MDTSRPPLLRQGWHGLPWLLFAGLVAALATGVVVPLVRVSLTGGPQFERSVALVPDVLPFGWFWLAGVLILAGLVVLSARIGPQGWMAPLICVAGIAGTVHVQAISYHHHGRTLLPRESHHANCHLMRTPADRSLHVSSDECGHSTMGSSVRDFLMETARAHPQLPELSGYNLHPLVGLWLVQPAALLLAVLGLYASLRLRLNRRPALSIVALTGFALLTAAVIEALHQHPFS